MSVVPMSIDPLLPELLPECEFVPLYDRILVQRIEAHERTKSGLFIPDAAKEKPQEGIVIKVGMGRVNDDGDVRPLIVQRGQLILFGKYAGTEIKIDGEEFVLMREDEVLGYLPTK